MMRLIMFDGAALFVVYGLIAFQLPSRWHKLHAGPGLRCAAPVVRHPDRAYRPCRIRRQTHKSAPARREETVTRPIRSQAVFRAPSRPATSDDARFDRLVYETCAPSEIMSGPGGGMSSSRFNELEGAVRGE